VPCAVAQPVWRFPRGIQTVSELVLAPVEAGAGAEHDAKLLALEVAADTVDRATNETTVGDWRSLLLRPFETSPPCLVRECPTAAAQLWYYDAQAAQVVAGTYSNSLAYGCRRGLPGCRGQSPQPMAPSHQCLALALDGPLQVWAAQLHGAVAVLLLNRGTIAAAITAYWTDLQLAADAPMHVRDVLERIDVGTSERQLTAHVPPHDVRLYRLSPVARSR
jgi:hypothetical protein